ncbi:MAG: hypothetical protein WAV95_05810 [Azonexus sp.]
MKKIRLAILAALAVVTLSACFPVFIPGGGHHGHGHGGHYGHHRGR